MNGPATFRAYCEVLQAIAETRGTTAKVQLFERWLRSLQTANDVEWSVRWAAEGAFPARSGRKAAAGPALTGTTAAALTGIDYETVFKTCRTALGSTTETIEKLLENIHWHGRSLPPAMPLEDMMERFEVLARTRTRDAKTGLLLQWMQEMAPLEVKFALRMAGQNSLRIGFELKSVLQAAAAAFDQPPAALTRAYTFTGDAGAAARAAFEGTLSEVRFSLFHPVPFMLAAAWEPGSALPPVLAAEYKLDGMRAQVHVQGDAVRLYSRDLNDLNPAFPDLLHALLDLRLPPLLLDGEIFVAGAGGAPDFNALQQRLGVKKPSLELIQKFPVRFVAYDLLFEDGAVLLQTPWRERRARLEAAAARFGLEITAVQEVVDEPGIRAQFQSARRAGYEGLMLKDPDAPYEPGQRRKGWLKVKEPARHLTTVILYAHAGSGKRGGTYSDFTLGVKAPAGSPTAFVPIGKAYGGYTDDELRKLNTALKPLALERFGPTLMVTPALVVDLEFDSIQKNPRTKAGFSLRFPRFKAIRWDLAPADCDSVEEVAARFEGRSSAT